jgi:hypothetical protein
MVATVVSSKPIDSLVDATDSLVLVLFPSPLSSSSSRVKCFHFIRFNTDPPSKYGITTHRLDFSINEQ